MFSRINSKSLRLSKAEASTYDLYYDDELHNPVTLTLACFVFLILLGTLPLSNALSQKIIDSVAIDGVSSNFTAFASALIRTCLPLAIMICHVYTSCVLSSAFVRTNAAIIIKLRLEKYGLSSHQSDYIVTKEIVDEPVYSSKDNKSSHLSHVSNTKSVFHVIDNATHQPVKVLNIVGVIDESGTCLSLDEFVSVSDLFRLQDYLSDEQLLDMYENVEIFPFEYVETCQGFEIRRSLATGEYFLKVTPKK